MKMKRISIITDDKHAWRLSSSLIFNNAMCMTLCVFCVYIDESE